MFLVMGVAAALGFNVLVSVAMVIGYMPVTGMPLPLMSYGGSARLFVSLAIGLVMNVRIRRFVNWASRQSRALGCKIKSRAGSNFRIERVRTASSAVCPGPSRQRVTRNSSSLERQRTHFVVGHSGIAGNRPSAFEQRAASLQVSHACVPVLPGPPPLFRTHLGQKLAAIRPKAISCLTNWLPPRAPTHGW